MHISQNVIYRLKGADHAAIVTTVHADEAVDLSIFYPGGSIGSKNNVRPYGGGKPGYVLLDVDEGLVSRIADMVKPKPRTKKKAPATE